MGRPRWRARLGRRALVAPQVMLVHEVAGRLPFQALRFEHGMRFAVIENEFGLIVVYEKVLSETTDNELFEVMNRRVRCTLR